MGMYTELRIASSIKEDTPKNIIDLLARMVKGMGEEYEGTLPDHPLFKTDRWGFMLNCDSYYFDADTKSVLRFDDIAKQYYLTIQCNFKNYDNELREFLSWVNPYLDKLPGEFIGYSRYEEDETPTLIYYQP